MTPSFKATASTRRPCPPAPPSPRDGGTSQYLLIGQAFDVDIGHAGTVALIEEHITE
jgi:hypothetical protein